MRKSHIESNQLRLHIDLITRLLEALYYGFCLIKVSLREERNEMPRATVDIETTHRVELATCPEGFVELRRLSYGQFLHRRQMASSLRMEQEGKNNMTAVMNMVNEAVTQYEFSHCIVDHNLEDETGRKLDFVKPSDIKKLDPRIGEEIDQAISKLNNYEPTEQAEGNS